VKNNEELTHMRSYINRSRFLYPKYVDDNPTVLMMELDEAIDEINRRREKEYVKMQQL